MLKRDSKFPGETRQTSIGRNSKGPGVKVLRHPLLAMTIIAAGLFLYEMPDRPWEPYVKQLQALWDDLSGSQLTDGKVQTVGSGENSSYLGIEVKQAKSPQAAKQSKPEAKPNEPGGESLQLDVSISKGFRPVGFKIAAVPQAIKLTAKPISRVHRLPRFSAPKQKYGLIKLARGLEFGFAIDLSASGYKMYLDRNLNGDLSDDGPPLINQGRSLFASRLSFPLKVVAGIPSLKGEYQIWIYTNPDSWQRGEMLFYSMTQLRGELLLKGKRYTAFLADNGPVDGNYHNDGINIDLDGNGKIDRAAEFFPGTGPALIDNVSYTFRITR